MERDGGAAVERCHGAACSYVGMHVPVKRDGGLEPSSGEHDALTRRVSFRIRTGLRFTSTFNAGKQTMAQAGAGGFAADAHGLFFDANYTLAKNQADNQGDAPSAFAGEVNYGIPVADQFQHCAGLRQRGGHAASADAADRPCISFRLERAGRG